MKILGIANSETASACLVIGNKVVSAASEERFTRVKMDDSFPKKSIEYVLQNSNLELADIDWFIDQLISGWPQISMMFLFGIPFEPPLAGMIPTIFKLFESSI